MMPRRSSKVTVALCEGDLNDILEDSEKMGGPLKPQYLINQFRKVVDLVALKTWGTLDLLLLGSHRDDIEAILAVVKLSLSASLSASLDRSFEVAEIKKVVFFSLHRPSSSVSGQVENWWNFLWKSKIPTRVNLLNVKFIGCQVEFGIAYPYNYTLTTLWADVYMFVHSTIPDPSESFKVKVRLPWNGEYKLIKNNNELKEVFNMFNARDIETLRMDMELLPLTSLTPVESGEPEPPVETSLLSNNGGSSMKIYPQEFKFISSDEEMFSIEDDEDYTPCDDSVRENISFLVGFCVAIYRWQFVHGFFGSLGNVWIG
ncbi:hypothetical protein JRO89_XSUnG0016400 [Xanthoceras sorbifolium]|uniref:F-box protein n=1 Tax=Xanthoceras sorbifolium TaxID=99658 RepID=A0ABQ8H095_9ROSI|nr:hypothetical protein JRO89_XSUnG0016400 [Xanthoceras sorbifolium]